MRIRSLVNSLKYAGAEDLPEYDVTRGICIGVNTMCIYIILLNLVSGLVFYLLSRSPAVLIGAYAEAALVYGITRLNKKKKFELANIFFYTVINIATFYFSAILGSGSETQLMILFILGLIFFIFERRRTRLFCIGITIVLLALLEANYIYHFIPPASFSVMTAHLVRWLVYVVVISLVLLIFHLYRKNTLLLIQLHTYSKKIQTSLTAEERLNELKNHFFQSVSHDIRGAYFTIGTLCATIHRKMKSREVLSSEITDTLIEASEHYKYMLNYFLEVSKFKDGSLDALQLESFNVSAEIEKIVALHQHIARQKHIRIDIVSSFGFPEYIIGDKLKITRIFYNLLTNALKFTRPHSHINVNIHFHGNSWQLAVSDEGKGMTTHQLARVFQPFATERSTQNPEGIGLGLYITKQLAELLNADIAVDSQTGKGTCFRVNFELEKQLIT